MAELIPLSQLKLALRVTNYDEDSEITRKLDSATAECRNFIGQDIPLDVDGNAPADLVNGIVLMVQADYELDPLKRDVIRNHAETIWQPYRTPVMI